QLWIGLRGTNGWTQKEQLTTNAGDYANPTPTVDGSGQLCVSYEEGDTNGNWDIQTRWRNERGDFKKPQHVTGHVPGGKAVHINHRAVPHPISGIVATWQTEFVRDPPVPNLFQAT